MAFGATPRDSGSIPLGSVYSPNVGLIALQGGVSQTDGSANQSGAVVATNVDGQKPTYSASGTVVPVTGATDLVTIIGSATRTIKIVRIVFSGTILTTTINGSVSLIKRSAVDTAGTQTAPTMVAHDSGNAAATARSKCETRASS